MLLFREVWTKAIVFTRNHDILPISQLRFSTLKTKTKNSWLCSCISLIPLCLLYLNIVCAKLCEYKILKTFNCFYHFMYSFRWCAHPSLQKWLSCYVNDFFQFSIRFSIFCILMRVYVDSSRLGLRLFHFCVAGAIHFHHSLCVNHDHTCKVGLWKWTSFLIHVNYFLSSSF